MNEPTWQLAFVSDDEERIQVRDFLEEHIHELPADAVPASCVDYMYNPRILAARDKSSNDIVGAALSCHPHTLAASIMMTHNEAMPQMPNLKGLERFTEKVSELDLMAVSPSHRRKGLGTQLVNALEYRLKSDGCKVWYGCSTDDLAVDELLKFYTKAGFRIATSTQGLPPLLGVQWDIATFEKATFHFYKRL